MVGKAKKSTHGKKASSKALAKRRSSKAPAQKKRVEIDETVSNQIILIRISDPRTTQSKLVRDRIGPDSNKSYFLKMI